MADYQDANKINGRLVAKGVARYVAYGPKSETGYVFNRFACSVDEGTLAQFGVSQDDLMDCIKQLEAMGSFDDVMKKNGVDLRRYQGTFYTPGGYQTPGIVVANSKNPKLMMTVIPVATNKDPSDVIFEWYFDVDRTGNETNTPTTTVMVAGEDIDLDALLDIEKMLDEHGGAMGSVMLHKRAGKYKATNRAGGHKHSAGYVNASRKKKKKKNVSEVQTRQTESPKSENEHGHPVSVARWEMPKFGK